MNALVAPLLRLALALALAPLLLGVVNRVKAKFAGRCGKPLLQVYFDVAKLLRKGAVFSTTTTWAFGLGPALGLAATASALLLVPQGGLPGLISFSGDFVLLAYLLAAGRLATMLSALDTGSSFEGMGASREAAFSALAEPALFLGLAALAAHRGGLSLQAMLAGSAPGDLAALDPAPALAALSLFVVLLAENCRIPVDDPTTHLELTMVHEVMVLDHGGPDLGLIEYAAALKLWLYCALVAGVLLPSLPGRLWPDTLLSLAVILALGAAVGVVESVMARLRLNRVPQLLTWAAALSALALILKVWSAGS
jgi:formate hydrogenlyase subunit 4